MSPDVVGLASGDYYFIQILFCYKFFHLVTKLWTTSIFCDLMLSKERRQSCFRSCDLHGIEKETAVRLHFLVGDFLRLGKKVAVGFHLLIGQVAEVSVPVIPDKKDRSGVYARADVTVTRAFLSFASSSPTITTPSFAYG